MVLFANGVSMTHAPIFHAPSYRTRWKARRCASSMVNGPRSMQWREGLISSDSARSKVGHPRSAYARAWMSAAGRRVVRKLTLPAWE